MASDISDSLRAEIARRARYRCEYCLLHESDAGFPHQIDHVVSRKHGGSSRPDNLAYACLVCNRNKGSDIASLNSETGEVVRLFDPRHDQWPDHFRIHGDEIVPLTSTGTVTVQLLKLNSFERITERRLLRSIGNYPPVY